MPAFRSRTFRRMTDTAAPRPRVAAARPRRRTYGRRRVTSRVTTAVVKRVLNRQLETKYVAANKGGLGIVVNASITPSIDAITILPDVQFQTGAATSNTREGDQIEPIKATLRGHIWFNPVPADIPNQEFTKILFVKMFIVASKTIKGSQFSGNLDNGLLENGGADPVTWVSSAVDFQAFYPVSKQNYTLLKTRTMKFVKNYGKTQGDTTAGSQPNIDMDRKTFGYSWKPPTLKYANDAQLQPSNHYPIMFLVAYSPGIDVGTTDWLNGALLYNFHTEMFYKDA